MAVGAIAACEGMFEWTREYLQERKAFGGPLSKMQVRPVPLDIRLPLLLLCH